MSRAAFSQETIRDFLYRSGGKVEYHLLVKHFKNVLSDKDARVLFKDWVNTLVEVTQDGSQKFLVLRQQFMFDANEGDFDEEDHDEDETDGFQEEEETEVPIYRKVPGGDPNTIGLPPTRVIPQLPPKGIQFQPQTSLVTAPITSASASGHKWSPAPGEQAIPPQPPPRRSKSINSRDAKPGKIDDKVRFLREAEKLDKDTVSIQSPLHHQEKLKEIHELAKTPGRVKEHAEKWNRMTSESDLKQQMSSCSLTPANGQAASGKAKSVSSQNKENRDDDTDSGSASVQPLDPLRKKWMLSASACDYSELMQMLREDSKLASFRTALHWAAKFGKTDIVKLVAGTYFADVNIRSGGYTALHLAAMFDHQDVYSLLTRVYHADPEIRDYSGKLAKQYSKESRTVALRREHEAKTKAQHRHQFGPSKPFNSHKHLQGRVSTESSSSTSAFTRIGSLNVKMRKTAKALTGIKSWGSSESVSESTVMPPPKQAPTKKKKGKKTNSSALQTVQASCGKDSDSDSAYGFH